MSAESHATLEAWLKKHAASATKDLVGEIKQPPLVRPPLGQARVFPYGEITVKPATARRREESTGSILDFQDVRLVLYHTDQAALGQIVAGFTAVFSNQPLTELEGHMRTEPFTPTIEATKEKVDGNDVHRATMLWIVWRHIAK